MLTRVHAHAQAVQRESPRLLYLIVLAPASGPGEASLSSLVSAPLAQPDFTSVLHQIGN